ncbi:hypothetical protein SAMN04490355_10971, partial [Pelosinus propionicus DSM 13327]
YSLSNQEHGRVILSYPTTGRFLPVYFHGSGLTKEGVFFIPKISTKVFQPVPAVHADVP